MSNAVRRLTHMICSAAGGIQATAHVEGVHAVLHLLLSGVRAVATAVLAGKGASKFLGEHQGMQSSGRGALKGEEQNDHQAAGADTLCWSWIRLKVHGFPNYPPPFLLPPRWAPP